MNFFRTFRGRLLVILALLLIVTLGVQFYLNYRKQQENNALRELQENALVAGFALGVNSLTSENRLSDFVKSEGQTFFDERTTERIRDIIVIDEQWRIYDSLNTDYLPTTNDKDETVYKNLADLQNLPPLVEGEEKLGTDAQHFPNAPRTNNKMSIPANEAQEKTVQNASDQNARTQNAVEEGEARAIPIETDRGRWYVMVILKTDKGEVAKRAAQSLIYTLLILLATTLVTFYLVWRFTRPITNLSNAARSIAEGDLSVRIEGAERRDEMGKLAAQFNEMTAELEKKQELELKLREAEKSAVVGRLASAIAHEIRNPLNYINLTLDHLRNKFQPEDNDRQQKFDKLTWQLKSEVERINRQISDFLRYSRPVKLELQPLDARKVVEDSLRIVEAQAEDQNIKISLIEREDVPKIVGDTEILRSVFNNLFINSVQAMEKDGGILHVTISPEDEFVKIEIKDTGTGIEEAHLEKIFEPYFSTKETGTGLGLAIVRKIIEDHSGMIEVGSIIGEGTIFTVKLPKAVG